MRLYLVMLMAATLTSAGCGWSPPGAPPPKADTCAPTDGPDADTVQRELVGIEQPAGPWAEVARGHALNCRLYWVQIAPTTQQPDRPQQVLFFDRRTPLGPATPEPRPYVSVLTGGDDTVTVQYQWRQGDEAPCCPTGIGTVRFRIGADGKLEAVDPIPNS